VAVGQAIDGSEEIVVVAGLTVGLATVHDEPLSAAITPSWVLPETPLPDAKHSGVLGQLMEVSAETVNPEEGVSVELLSVQVDPESEADSMRPTGTLAPLTTVVLEPTK
jgi:hypothetical protein